MSSKAFDDSGRRIEVPQVRVDTQRFYDQEWLAVPPEKKQP
jgi:hypothetical protein